MKALFILMTTIMTFKASACSCDFDYDESLRFKTPYSEDQAEKLIEKVFGAEMGEIKEIKYYSNLFERLYFDGSTCFSRGPNNEPQFYCRQSYKAKWEVQIPKLNCTAIVKVKRTKRISTAKLVSHTCL